MISRRAKNRNNTIGSLALQPILSQDTLSAQSFSKLSGVLRDRRVSFALRGEVARSEGIVVIGMAGIA